MAGVKWKQRKLKSQNSEGGEHSSLVELGFQMGGVNPHCFFPLPVHISLGPEFRLNNGRVQQSI